MPTYGAQVDHSKIPVKGFVPEQSASAPSSPATGQMYTDTSVTPKVVRYWDGAAWQRMDQVGAELTANKGAANGYASLDAGTKIPIAQIPTGSTSTTVPLGNDSRLSDQRVPTDASVTGGTAGAGVKIAAATITAANIANATITDVQVAAANKDGAAGTASMRTLGSGAQQAMAGNTRLDQVTAPAAAVSLNSQEITNLGAPTAASSAARLQDVQNAQAGIDVKPSVRAATTANGALATAFANGQAIDGVTLATGDRILLKNQTTATENGLYTVNAAGAPTRTSDTITANSFVFVEEGTTQADTGWMVTNNGAIVLGTTALAWTQFGSATSYIGTTNRITVSGNTIDISSAYVGQATITTVGTITTGVWTGTAIAVANGGTGATSAANARANLNVPQRGFATTLGALVAGTPATVTHNLGTLDVVVQCYTVADGAEVILTVVRTTTNAVTVQADQAYAANAVRVVVEPIT